jgi:hypothetical protein
VSVRDCARHRPWLAARAARTGAEPACAPEVPAEVDLDLDRHLAACRACRTEVEELALLSFAIRRAWREMDDHEPPADAWLRLRERVSRPGPSRRLAWAASSIAGVALGTALAIGLIVPLGMADGLHGASRVVDESGSPATPGTVTRTSEDRAELSWLRAHGATDVVGVGYSGIDGIPATGPRAVFATVRREQSRYAEDRWDERPPGAAAVPPAIVL